MYVLFLNFRKRISISLFPHSIRSSNAFLCVCVSLRACWQAGYIFTFKYGIHGNSEKNRFKLIFLHLYIYMCVFIILFSYTLYFCICRMEQSLFLLELCILSSWLLAVKENSISGSGVNQSLTEMHRYCTPLNVYLQNDLYALISKIFFCFQRILHCIIHEPCSWD